MPRSLSDILTALTDAWDTSGRTSLSQGLKDAPDGASSGTEGLLMMVEYLCSLVETDRNALDMVSSELNDLIQYCTDNGISLSNRLVEYRKPHS
jgi:hypothetical protein